MEVKNKVVIVTGAGSGIGKAAAIHFATHGATVVVSDLNFDSAKKLSNEIGMLLCSHVTKGRKPGRLH